MKNFLLFLKKILNLIGNVCKKYLFIFLLLVFLYAPIIIIIIFSFSDGKSIAVFGSFTLDNYAEMFTHKPFLQAISTTLYVSIISTFASIIIGFLGAFSLARISKFIRSPMLFFSKFQLVMPDLMIGLSLFLLFTLINIKLGSFTLILSHISFSTPYVTLILYPKIKNLNYNQIYASYDLGASKLRTFFSIIIPQMIGSLISATVISFIMSFDDFIISFFTSGSQNNISTFLFSLRRPSFIVNSFSSFFLLFSTIIVFLSSFIKYRNEKKK